MPPDCTSAPDWACAAEYEQLRSLDRPGFAWELLRRNPHYRDAFAALRCLDPRGPILIPSPGQATFAARWGLTFPRGSQAAGDRRAPALAR